MAIDHVLKLYAETIQSPYLHYGFWDEPQAVDPERLRLEDIVQAQERYIEHLAGFIPEDVQSILDVGCGIGGNAAFLAARGYHVEALSPDTYQEMVIQQRFDGSLAFYRTKFERFDPPRRYDLILESESANYIKLQPGFRKARETLRDGGYLLVSDYFIHFDDGSRNPHLHSAHRLDRFLEAAREHHFALLREFDQTEQTMPTLDAACYFYQRFIEPTFEYAVNSLQRKYPRMLTFLKFLLGKQLQSKREQKLLLDSREFRKYRHYMIYLFQKQ
jgi:MPBQ/MSBQ methyltransferase